MQSHQLPHGHVVHRIRSSSGKAREKAWGCLTVKMGEPGVKGSPEVAEGVAVGTGAVKKVMVEMEMGRVRGVKERSLLPSGWAELRESHSFS